MNKERWTVNSSLHIIRWHIILPSCRNDYITYLPNHVMSFQKGKKEPISVQDPADTIRKSKWAAWDVLYTSAPFFLRYLRLGACISLYFS